MTQPAQPQTDPQQADRVDLEHVAEAFTAALLALLLLWGPTRTLWITSITEQIRHVLRSGIRGLDKLSLDSEHATQVVHDSMVKYVREAAQHVADEAAAQGVTVDAGTVEQAVAKVVASKTLDDQAAVATSLLADALETSAASEAVRIHGPDSTPEETAAKVERYLHTLTDAQVQYVLGAVLHGAQNDARIATLLDARSEGYEVRLFASERMDNNVCAPCRAVHGRYLGAVDGGDLPLVRELYPVRGYIDCLGRDRCRGTVVGVWVQTA